MVGYIVRRVLLLIPVLIVISIVIFTIIQLPPGDYLTSYIIQLEESGMEVSESQAAALKRQYGLDKSVYSQYFLWMGNILLRGDFGRSFNWNKPMFAPPAPKTPTFLYLTE